MFWVCTVQMSANLDTLKAFFFLLKKCTLINNSEMFVKITVLSVRDKLK